VTAFASFKVKGVKRWMKALDAGGFSNELRRNIAKATALNGKIAEAILRKTIQSGGNLAKNAALTISIKKSSKALVDSGLLFQSIASKVHDDFTVFVGVLRTSRNYNIAEIVTNGRTIKVTPKMRGMFAILSRASRDKRVASRLTGRAAALFQRMPDGWKKLGEGTNAIVIPGRNYFQVAFRNTQMVKQARDNWTAAVKKTFQEVAKKGDD